MFSTEGHPLPVFARRSDEENDAEDDATTSRKLGDEETPRVPDPLAPFESREFVRVVKSAVADAKRRARRERGSAEDDARAGGGARDVRLHRPRVRGLDLDLVPEGFRVPGRAVPPARRGSLVGDARPATRGRGLGRHRARLSQSPRRRHGGGGGDVRRLRRRRRRRRRDGDARREAREVDEDCGTIARGVDAARGERGGREAERRIVERVSLGSGFGVGFGNVFSREPTRDGERVSRARQRSASRVRSRWRLRGGRRDVRAEEVLDPQVLLHREIAASRERVRSPVVAAERRVCSPIVADAQHPPPTHASPRVPLVRPLSSRGIRDPLAFLSRPRVDRPGDSLHLPSSSRNFFSSGSSSSNVAPANASPAPSNLAAASLALSSAALAMFSLSMDSSFFACDARVSTLFSTRATRSFASPARRISSSLDWTRLRSVEMASRGVVVAGLHRGGGHVVELGRLRVELGRLFEDESLRVPRRAERLLRVFQPLRALLHHAHHLRGDALLAERRLLLTSALTIGPEVGAELSAQDGTERAEEQPSKHSTTHGATHRLVLGDARALPLAERRARRRARHARASPRRRRGRQYLARERNQRRGHRGASAPMKRRGRARTTTNFDECRVVARAETLRTSQIQKTYLWLLVRGPSRVSHRHARTVDS